MEAEVLGLIINASLSQVIAAGLSVLLHEFNIFGVEVALELSTVGVKHAELMLFVIRTVVEKEWLNC